MSFDDVVLSKGGFKDHKNDIFLLSKNVHILKGVTSRLQSQVPNIFQTYFSVRETLVLSFEDVVFLKEGFLDHKNDIFLLSKNLHILKGVTSRFPSQIPNIFPTYFSVRETLVLSFDMLFSQKEPV